MPLPVEPFSIRLLTLYRVSPSGVFGCFAIGLVSGALGGLLPAYGLSMGMSTHGVAALLTAALIGGALAYYPAGALSDRMDRRIIVIVLSGLSIALCGVLVLNPQLSPRAVLLVVGAFGFTQYPLYGICVAMTNDRVREQSFSEVASELLIIYGSGTILGPIIAAGFMHYGSRYLFLFMALVFLVLVAFIAARTRRTARTPREMKIKSHPLETAPNSMRMFRPRE